MDQYDDSLPRARAGHCSVAVSFNRCYVLAFFVICLNCQPFICCRNCSLYELLFVFDQINTRLYMWSGRDGYRKAWNNQVSFAL